jgi:hypothetical protein
MVVFFGDNTAFPSSTATGLGAASFLSTGVLSVTACANAASAETKMANDRIPIIGCEFLITGVPVF